MPATIKYITQDYFTSFRNLHSHYNSIMYGRQDLFEELHENGRTLMFNDMLEKMIKLCTLFNQTIVMYLNVNWIDKGVMRDDDIVDLVRSEMIMLRDNLAIISEASCNTAIKKSLEHNPHRYALYVEMFD